VHCWEILGFVESGSGTRGMIANHKVGAKAAIPSKTFSRSEVAVCVIRHNRRTGGD
jgi:hypothetical protein